MDPRDNPYLAHMYPEKNRSSSDGAFAKFTRHQTTTALAQEAESSDLNPFNDKPFSSTYFSILKTRRNLPVHAQRYGNASNIFGLTKLTLFRAL